MSLAMNRPRWFAAAFVSCALVSCESFSADYLSVRLFVLTSGAGHVRTCHEVVNNNNSTVSMTATLTVKTTSGEPRTPALQGTIDASPGRQFSYSSISLPPGVINVGETLNVEVTFNGETDTKSSTVTRVQTLPPPGESCFTP